MVNPMRPFLFLALLSLLGAPACGGDDDGGEGDGAGDVDGGGGDEDNRFAGHWSTCEFGRRLEFATPAPNPPTAFFFCFRTNAARQREKIAAFSHRSPEQPANIA